MDLFRARASAALAALLLAGGAAAADCSALAGTYAFDSVEKPDGTPRTLAELAPDKHRGALYRYERPAASTQPGFASGQLRARPARPIPLAASVRLAQKAGAIAIHYLDASGKVLVETPLAQAPARWKCDAGQLKRSFETMGGLGNAIRTERTEQVLSRTGEGDLLLAETTAVVKPAGTAPPRRSESHFKHAAPSR